MKKRTKKKAVKRTVKPRAKKTTTKRAKRTTAQKGKSPKMRKIAELEREATRSLNAAKTARNFSRTAKDKGIRALYLQAARHNIQLAREAQKKALEILKSVK